MTWVHFNLGSMGDDPSDPGLPIEVRDASMTLVSETTAQESVQLQPGSYLVSARLPGGQELSKLIDLKGDDVVCRLTPDAAGQPSAPYEQRSKAPGAGSRGSGRSSARSEETTTASESPPPARLRTFRGNVIDGSI